MGCDGAAYLWVRKEMHKIGSGGIANCTEIQEGQREIARMNVQNKLGELSTYLSYSGSIVLTWTTTIYILGVIQHLPFPGKRISRPNYFDL